MPEESLESWFLTSNNHCLRPRPADVCRISMEKDGRGFSKLAAFLESRGESSCSFSPPASLTPSDWRLLASLTMLTFQPFSLLRVLCHESTEVSRSSHVRACGSSASMLQNEVHHKFARCLEMPTRLQLRRFYASWSSSSSCCLSFRHTSGLCRNPCCPCRPRH